MKKIGLLLTFLVASLPSFAQAQRPAVYIAPQNGFETYLGAAMAKKGVPIDIVMDQTKAAYLLKAGQTGIHRSQNHSLPVRFLRRDRGQRKRFCPVHWNQFEQDAVGVLGEQTERREQEPAIHGWGGCQTPQGIHRKKIGLCSPLQNFPDEVCQESHHQECADSADPEKEVGGEFRRVNFFLVHRGKVAPTPL
jgi:hypothetical protein